VLANVVGADRHPPIGLGTAALPDVDEDQPLASFSPPPLAPVVAAPAPAARRGPRRLLRSKPAAQPAPEGSASGAQANAVVPEQTTIFGAPPTVTPPSVQAAVATRTPTAEPLSGLTGELERANASTAEAGSDRQPGMPGAYLAPSATYVAPLTARPPDLANPPLPTSPAPVPSSAAPTWKAPAWSPGATRIGSIAGPRAADVSTEDTGRPLPDWLILGGSTLAIVSFVLPWATDGVLGSNGIGYTAQWGLANGGYVALIAAAAVLLVLHVASTPLPGWIRSGVLPLAIGGLLAGLAFAYYARPFGGGTGVAVLLAGAVLLLVGGLLASRPGRNATDASTV
jgi:hypothetical protein